MRTYTANVLPTEGSSGTPDHSESTEISDQVELMICGINADGIVKVFEFQVGELSMEDLIVLSVPSWLARNPEAQEALYPFPAYLRSLLGSEPITSRATLGTQILEASLPRFSDEDEEKPMLLHLLGHMYNYQAFAKADPRDLEKAVCFNTQANLLAPDGHGYKSRILSALGISYRMRFEQLGDLNDLERAIEYHTHACQLISDERPHKPALLLDLAASFMTRFLHRGDLGDLHCAIMHYEKAVLLTPQGDPETSHRLDNLGASLLNRSQRLNTELDLERAISYHRQAIQIAPSESLHKPAWLCNLGKSLLVRFKRLGSTEDLEEALSYQRQAILLASDEHIDKPDCLMNLGRTLHSRYLRMGDIADLSEAIYNHNQAILLCPDGSPNKALLLGGLGLSQMSRFQKLGDLVDLDNAIIHLYQAVQLTPEGHTRRPTFLCQLGTLHFVRFDHLDDMADLELAISYHEKAVLLTPEGHPYLPGYLYGLGQSYESRFLQGNDMADLESAISYQTQAVSLVANDNIGKSILLNSLGAPHSTRFKCLSNRSDLDKEISYNRQAISLIPEGHPLKARVLWKLGDSHVSKFELSGAQEDLDDAIAQLSQALRLAPDEYEFTTNILVGLGLAYRKQFVHFRDNGSLSQSINYFQRAAKGSTGGPRNRLQAARYWARTSDISSLEGYKQAIGLVPQIVWLGSTVNHRYRHTLTIGNTIAEAAIIAIQLHQYELALEWLEEGNSIVWKQILQLRTPLDDLRHIDSGLADQLEKTAKELDRASIAMGEYPPLDSISTENAAQSHRRLAERYECLLGQARDLPGLSNFLRPKKSSDLMFAARCGPVVVLSVHKARCDALILLPNSNAITHVPLPRLSYEATTAAHNQLAQLLHESHVKKRGFKSRTFASPDIMEMLWQSVVKPILEHLGYMTPSHTSELPHITWCTSGPLAFLPLHAAGCYKEPHERAFNYAISSYAPTLSSLLAPIPGPETFHGVLAVGQANTPGHPQLPATEAEISQVERQAGTLPVQRLTEDHATVAAVLSAMEDYSWIHMACHASQNRTDPTRSAFHLHDGALELSSIMQKSLKGKGLAFLSACETATGDAGLPSEAVHLAAGMLMAGYRSVIATMWSIQDEDAPLIAGKVYAQLFEGGVADTEKTAKALHDAVGCLRAEVGENNFARWVPYIHIGL